MKNHLDAEQAKSYGSQDVGETDINIYDFDKIQKLESQKLLQRLLRN